MKKLAALSLVILMLAGTVATCFASGIITPFYSHTASVSASLSFSGGKANCSGQLKPSGDYNSSITVTLYKQNGSSWTSVTSWSGSATNGYAASAGGSVSVGNGTYKVTTSGTVKDSGGNVLERPSASSTKTK